MINAYLKDTLTLKTVTVDKWGNKTSTSITGVKCRITSKTRLITTQTGEQVVSMAEVLMGLRTLSHQDMLNIDGVDRKILHISKEAHFSNTHMLVRVA